MGEPQSRTDAGRFPKGRSGNPKGRARIKEDVRAALEAACPEAVARLIQLSMSDDEGISLKASLAIVEHVKGKASQALEHSGPGGEPLTIIIRDLTKE